MANSLVPQARPSKPANKVKPIVMTHVYDPLRMAEKMLKTIKVWKIDRC